MGHHSYFYKSNGSSLIFLISQWKKNFREKTPQVKNKLPAAALLLKDLLSSARWYSQFDRDTGKGLGRSLCPWDKFVQIALGQGIRNSFEWILYEFRTLFERLRTLFRIFENTDGKDGKGHLDCADYWFDYFESTFDLKALYQGHL